MKNDMTENSVASHCSTIAELKWTILQYHEYIKRHFAEYEFPTFVQEWVDEAMELHGGEEEIAERIDSHRRLLARVDAERDS